MNEARPSPVAPICLIAGAVLGLGGSFAPSASLRGLAWGIDGIALVVAAALLAVHLLRRGQAGSSRMKREAVMHEWHKFLLHEAVPKLIQKWESKLGVEVANYFLQRMKTKWGGCNPRAGHIRLNTELVKKPKDLLEYVVVHQMMHLIEPTHSERFVTLLSRHFPAWREARAELNELPLGAAKWNE